MRNDPVNRAANVLAFAAVVELGTGVALLAAPASVAGLLLGAELPVVGAVVGRCFGIALVALAVACWPGRKLDRGSPSAVRGMLLYNALIAAFLTWLGSVGHMSGLLLWPAAALHVVVGVSLSWTWRTGRHTPAPARE